MPQNLAVAVGVVDGLLGVVGVPLVQVKVQGASYLLWEVLEGQVDPYLVVVVGPCECVMVDHPCQEEVEVVLDRHAPYRGEYLACLEVGEGLQVHLVQAVPACILESKAFPSVVPRAENPACPLYR